jgi:hypothetical protein
MSVQVNYLHPGTGTTVPSFPTNESKNLNMVVAVLTGVLATDTQVFITHNLSITDITSGFPNVGFTPLDPSFYTADWYVLSQASQYTMLAKTISVGALSAGSQMIVTIQRPHSIVK